MSKQEQILPKSFQTHTFGCKVNYADSMHMEGSLRSVGGYDVPVDSGVSPETIVVNTCTVTQAADRQARSLIRKLSRKHPSSKIVVTGCSVVHEAEKYQNMTQVHRVVPIVKQSSLPQIVGWEDVEHQNPMPVLADSKRTRANIKLQDGCNAYCSFCILPYIRGRSKSIPLSELLPQVQHFISQGHVEIVTTGTHIGAYGRDLDPRLRLSDALKAFLSLDKDIRLRISSIEPSGITPDLVALVQQEDRIRPHFHVPMQSGSDFILKRMNRKYKASSYHQKISRLARSRSFMGLGSDVIVGFPGESVDDFEQTRSMIEQLPFTYLHVFPYSERPGTKSVQFKDDVAPQEKKRRVNILRDLSAQKQKVFLQSLLGRSHKVLFEKRKDHDGLLIGRSEHYAVVKAKGNDRLMERELEVKFVSIQNEASDSMHIIGEVL
ncbi:MAG: tRNA (N(6)-L-threonylcarbamoyladenosine(37)-C(2))-methylthiotransferase MtaB [Bdellovibrionales bacterium]|nr:tRNA (N(6)-L-threonylcarbamoyladenosine(37)-C(2))-methylthiotransferase MtaB [Bdellovibrionales bacterium]